MIGPGGPSLSTSSSLAGGEESGERGGEDTTDASTLDEAERNLVPGLKLDDAPGRKTGEGEAAGEEIPRTGL